VKLATFMRSRIRSRLESGFRRIRSRLSKLGRWYGPCLSRPFVVIAIALLGVACGALKSTPKVDPSLRPLGKATATDFRRAFDEAQGKTRFIVALSPT
jgi:hypothetical protein